MNKTSKEEEMKMKEYKEINIEKLDKVSGGLHSPSDTRVPERNSGGRPRGERKSYPVVGIYTNW